MGLFGLGRGEPVHVEFSLGLVSLTPWPANPPLRRLAFRWQRGSKRFGVSRAVHPRLEEAAPRGSPLTYEFDDTLVVPATLYKSSASSRGGVRSRFNSKELVLTLLEVDPSGKSAVDVATLTLDLGQLVDTEASTKTLAVVPLPGVPTGGLVPYLTLRVSSRVLGAAPSSLADSDDHRSDLGAGPESADTLHREGSQFNDPAYSTPDSPMATKPAPAMLASQPSRPELLRRAPAPPPASQAQVPPPLPPRAPSPPPRAPSPPPPLPPRAPSPPPPLPQRPRSPSPPPRPQPPVPAAAPPELVAQLAAAAAELQGAKEQQAKVAAELEAAKKQLAAEQARSRQLQEAAAAQQFKFDLLVDMYTLQMLDQDLLMEVHDAAAPMYPGQPKAVAH